jgi:hypothetical protein
MDADVKFALRGGGYLKGVMGMWQSLNSGKKMSNGEILRSRVLGNTPPSGADRCLTSA